MQKKLAALLVVALVSSMFLFGNQTDNELWEAENIAEGLDSKEKRMVFEVYKKNWDNMTLLNVFCGLGLGSFLNGDAAGGVVGLLGDLTSLGLIIGGAVTGGGGSPVAIAGYVSMFVFKLFEIIQPAVFAKSYNLKLLDAVLGDVDLAVLPVMGAQVPGMAFVGSVSF